MIRPPPSTVESLDNEKVLHWIKDIQIPTIDEECASICSGETTKDDMLNYIYGKNSMKDGQKKKNDINEISTSEAPYLSESVVFNIPDDRYSVNSSTISGDDFQVANGDNKHDVEKEHLNYDQSSPSPPIEGCYVDYRTASMSHKDHQNQMATVLQDYTDDSIFEVAKQSEDNDGMPPVAVNVDTGVYSTSCFGDSPIPPPDGGYTSCTFAMRPIDKTTSYNSTGTPISPTLHHSDQSMPFGEYVNHSIQ